MTEFKVGDRVRAIPECSSDFVNGEGIIEEMLASGEMRIRVTKQSRYYVVGSLTNRVDWSQYIELITSPEKPPKPQPVDLHLLMEDSCKNVIKVCDNYDEAKGASKNYEAKQTIYKLVKVADVSSIRQITKVRAEPKPKPKLKPKTRKQK